MGIENNTYHGIKPEQQEDRFAPEFIGYSPFGKQHQHNNAHLPSPAQTDNIMLHVQNKP
ncbi:hypothetical protein ACE4RU_06850 [Actinobacillus seminis]|uniref:hypothetical protein n=1 Tax=Actinobacillus seminis TaxID=722 RepID=UPI003B94BC0C